MFLDLGVIRNFDLIFNNISDMVFLSKVEGECEFRYTLVNDTAKKFLGLTNDMIGKRMKEVLPEKQAYEICQKYNEAIDTKETVSYQISLPTIIHTQSLKYESNDYIYWESNATPIFNEDGNCSYIVEIVRDITERKTKEKEIQKYMEQLQESEERYRLIAENSFDLIKVVDRHGFLTYASPSHLKILGISPQEYLHKSIYSFVHKEDECEFSHSLKQSIETKEPFSLEIRQRKNNGEWIWVETIGTPVIDRKGYLLKVIFQSREISERKQYEEKLKKQALNDHLTGLPNRIYFSERIKEDLEHAKYSNKLLSVMVLDLDNFKVVNDSMGHDVGDELLVKFGERVKGCLRETDVLARIGGDEFVILLPELTCDDEAIDLAQRILHSLQEKWVIGEYEFNTTSSIGIAINPPYEIDSKAFLKQADIALYKAKEKGRNNYQVYPV